MKATPMTRRAAAGLLLLILLPGCAAPSPGRLARSSAQVSSTMKATAFVLDGYSNGTVSRGYLHASLVQYGQELSQEEQALKSQEPTGSARAGWVRTVSATQRASSLAASASAALPTTREARVLALRFTRLAGVVSPR